MQVTNTEHPPCLSSQSLTQDQCNTRTCHSQTPPTAQPQRWLRSLHAAVAVLFVLCWPLPWPTATSACALPCIKLALKCEH